MESGDQVRASGSGISRRTFLKGVVASGVAASSSAYLFRTSAAAQAPVAAQQATERLITLQVNGATRRVEVPHQETLAITLRYRLGLTGTKLGCDRAECGNCTVLIDGVPRYSCSTLTHTVRGKEITTIEGLAGPGGRLHPVQQAFVDELGFQCGFCTPGMVMTAVGVLAKNPHPTREQVAEALSGNLCRCGTYPHYVNAVMRAAEVS
ncbi:(2Fe-2S)-binding protein [Limnochorda pilosa]|uniref:(2Fe-2S)-binding protein n=1 Tax=Limnochorda pilosa TaxID=1555112 RepID=A0A0K2SPJ6_LIMPI|nr:(2Fe-2S)-binding protein [Limnochorda pilosa]BAS28739.1 (2Fe-2S)-binding protein [Limnochorda pilosa]